MITKRLLGEFTAPRLAIVGCACAIVLLSFITTRAAEAQSQQNQSNRASSQRYKVQLESLVPARPMEYFELAEEIADAAENDDDRALARHLFALAGALDADRLGRSAALALADMESDQQAKRRLQALASLLGIGAGGASNDTFTAPQPGSQAALTVCEALSLYRRGRGPQALSKLEDDKAGALIRQYGDVLVGGYNQFVQDCRIYRGDLRPKVDGAELARMLRLEEALLAGDDRSWSSDLLVNNGAPLIEIDPARIAETLKVDPEKNIYRGGKWGAGG